MQELTGQTWPERLSQFLCQANDLCEAARQKKRIFSANDVAAFATLYNQLLQDGERLNPEALKPSGKRGRVKQSVAFNLLRRRRQYADAVLCFIGDHTVPFTNNIGEHGVRMPKVKQKISGCLRTFESA